MYEKEVIEKIKKEYPKFKIIKKSESVLMKIIHWTLFLLTFGKMDKFMSSFITTLGYTVYTNENWESFDDKDRASILFHESIHMRQRKEKGLLRFSLGYLFWPLPIGYADFRLDMEVEAVAEQILFGHEKFGWPIKWLKFYSTISVLSGPEYFWPTFSSLKVEKKLSKKLLEMKAE